jgi:hypothetical protein
MLEDHDESALLGQLRDECKKISLMVEQFEDLIINLEQPSTQASTDVRQLRSAPKTARERMDQIANRFKKFRSQTESTFEQLMSRMNTFQSGGNTSGTTTDATTHPAVLGKLRKREEEHTLHKKRSKKQTESNQKNHHLSNGPNPNNQSTHHRNLLRRLYKPCDTGTQTLGLLTIWSLSSRWHGMN